MVREVFATAVLVLGCFFGVVVGAPLWSAPPMGFNTWNAFGCDLKLLNEPNIRRAARLLNETGLVTAGYNLFVIDDCWSVKDFRDDSNRLVADRDRFPSGMKELGKFLKNQGMLFGLYGDAGTRTCEGYPGSRYYEEEDAKLFAEWEVDYLKYDGCNLVMTDMKEAYTAISNNLTQTGRPIMLSCSWPAYDLAMHFHTPETFDWTYLSSICDTWRLFADISPNWQSIFSIMDFWAEHQDALSDSMKLGSFPDPDFLQVGHAGLTSAEGRTQMAVWSILSAPLILSTNILNSKWADPKSFADFLDDEAINTLTNADLIAMNQAFPPVQGRRVFHSKFRDVWARCLDDNDSLMVVIVNRLDKPQPLRLNWRRLLSFLLKDGHFPHSALHLALSGKGGKPGVNVKNVWRQQELGVVQRVYQHPTPLGGRDCVVLKLWATESPAQPQLSHINKAL